MIDIRHPATTYLEDDEGRVDHERAYRDTTSDYYDFDGTLLADQHGGWGHSKPIVGFHHTLIEIKPAALAAGFRLERVEEPQWEADGALAYLPGEVSRHSGRNNTPIASAGAGNGRRRGTALPQPYLAFR